jgi:hypothetical protein
LYVQRATHFFSANLKLYHYRGFKPLTLVSSRLRCPNCGGRKITVLFHVPGANARGTTREAPAKQARRQPKPLAWICGAEGRGTKQYALAAGLDLSNDDKAELTRLTQGKV